VEETDIVNQVTETLGFQAKEKGITLQTEGLEDLPPLQADGSRLFKAFYNLINNAIPEVMKEGSITVRGTTDPDASTICISVIDTGRGMTPEIRDSLFTQHAVSRKAGGTGLGTKIVKDAIDAHGGQITVESELGVGTTFHIRLPIGGPTASPDSPF